MTATGLSCSDPELDPDLFIVCIIIIARIPNISSLTINDQSTITAILLTEQNRTELSAMRWSEPDEYGAAAAGGEAARTPSRPVVSCRELLRSGQMRGG